MRTGAVRTTWRRRAYGARGGGGAHVRQNATAMQGVHPRAHQCTKGPAHETPEARKRRRANAKDVGEANEGEPRTAVRGTQRRGSAGIRRRPWAATGERKGEDDASRTDHCRPWVSGGLRCGVRPGQGGPQGKPEDDGERARHGEVRTPGAELRQLVGRERRGKRGLRGQRLVRAPRWPLWWGVARWPLLWGRGWSLVRRRFLLRGWRRLRRRGWMRGRLRRKRLTRGSRSVVGVAGGTTPVQPSTRSARRGVTRRALSRCTHVVRMMIRARTHKLHTSVVDHPNGKPERSWVKTL